MNPSRKAKLIWHCRRGMLELDLILNRFANNHLDNITEEQIEQFDKLLTCIDPELYSWLMGYEQPTDKDLVEIVEFIKLHDKVR
ncbi:succinate dehydrogenase assembly factor 2 [Legionella cardiaca]|uniref:FAD assembly factor SdhE n=1 Tax=Legionella cardiaca TaxID=1071983 RepID=A0ABY8AVD2_9GAMM|nr:succinate dehydrogenase assembly factor 2 [Legionella cardiaca]WED44657.1 succinate dehydrogenase assembly factor 2 [Legionella cardiaca]